MYISGVPGTGKTATVRRVIDSLNSDLLMKHSFKVILLVHSMNSLLVYKKVFLIIIYVFK